MSSSTTCRAAVVSVPSPDAKPTLVVKDIPMPKPEPHQVLVKISHVAMNPTDVQSFDGNAFGDGAVLGCDFVGTVQEIGSDVTRLAEGDHIAGLIWGGEIPGLGAYSTHSLADSRISFKLPTNNDAITPAAAATVPLAVTTAWLALFSDGCLAINRTAVATTTATAATPPAAKPTILIWGGSSSVGQYAIQLASQHGLRVLTTCSPRHHDLVRSLGAAAAFDYRAGDVAAQIRGAAAADGGGGVAYVFDCIGNETSSATASEAVREAGGRLSTVRPGKPFTEKVTARTEVTDVMVWSAFLKDHRVYGDLFWPASKEDHELVAGLYDELPGWLESGRLKPSVPKVLTGGLDDIEKGFQEYRDNAISNYKIVYQL